MTALAETAERLHSIVSAVYGGAERSSDDAGMLLSIADWMDRIDDAMDEWLSAAGKPDRVKRGMQADLRRIAAARADIDPERLRAAMRSVMTSLGRGSLLFTEDARAIAAAYREAAE